jgi:AraC-like DNA-binding protein
MESASLLRSLDESLAIDGAPEPPVDRELTALLAPRIARDGAQETPYPGLTYYRISRPTTFHKSLTHGPMLTVVAQGRKLVDVGGKTLEYSAGRYLLITGEISFTGQLLEASPERPYLAVCLNIPGESVAKTLLALSDGEDHRAFTPEVDVPPAFVATLDARIRDAVVRLARAVEDPLERRIVAPMIIDELVFRLLRSDAAAAIRSAVPRGPDGASVARGIRFIRDNAHRPLSVAEVARHVAMSPSHFAHRFRAVARVSPMRYLKQVRMAEARQLMLAGGLRAAEAAARVGYQSASHFARDFKAIFGAAPATYAQRWRDATPRPAAPSRSQD